MGADALTQLVEQHDGKSVNNALKSEDVEEEEHSKETIDQLEQDVTRVLKERNAVMKKKITSRTSSLDSSCPPGSPFQMNPQLMSHDYAKSPLMEDIEAEDSEVAQSITDEISKPLSSNATDSVSTTAKKESPKSTEKNNDVTSEDNVMSGFDPWTKELFEPHRFAPKDLLTLLKTIESDIHSCKDVLRDETEKRKKHRIDDCRRVHDYDEFITTFLAMLAERGHLGDLLEYGLNINTTSTAKKKSVNSNSNNGLTNGSNSTSKSSKSSSSKINKKHKKSRGRPKCIKK